MRPSWLCKWRSKVKSHFLLYLRNHWSNRAQIFYACYVISQSYYIIKPSWHEAILAMQMKVKGQTPLCIVFQQPLVQSSQNFACICSVINQSYYIITTNWHEAILAMQMKVKGQISWILCLRYLKNRMSNHLQIFTVSLPWWRMDTIIFSAWSPNHDVI